MMATMENRRLAAARVLAGLTQRELARLVGSREIEISRIETGRVRPDMAVCVFRDLVLFPSQGLENSIRSMYALGLKLDQVEGVLDELRRLNCSGDVADQFLDSRATGTEPLARETAMGLLRFFTDNVLKHSAESVHIRWVAAKPLVMFWSTVAYLVQHPDARHAAVGYLSTACGGWLAEVPLEKCFLGLRREDAQKSLMDLSVGVFTDRTVRHMVGARLVGGLKTEVPYDLECLLQETEYLPKKFARHVK